MAAVERPPLPQQSADYITFPLEAHCGIFENGVLLMYTLEGVSSVANFITAYEESQLNRDSVFKSVVFLFPRAIFLTFIVYTTAEIST